MSAYFSRTNSSKHSTRVKFFFFIILLTCPIFLSESFGQCTSPTTLESTDFENGFGNWIDGGNRCKIKTNSSFSLSGSNSLELKNGNGDASSSFIDLDLDGYESINISFNYFGRTNENGDDFFLEISTDGGSNYAVLENWVNGGNPNFIDDSYQSVSIDYNGVLTSSVRIKIRMDGDSNNDYLYIDDVTISGCLPSLSDLSPSISSATDTVEAGAALSIVGIISNLDVEDASNVDVRYLLSEDNAPDAGDVVLNSTIFPLVSASSIENYDISSVIPISTTPGDYFLISQADYNNTIVESNEGNNDFAKAIHILAAPTCSDGIQNGDEAGIDCGGTECDPCPTCFDGIQNGGETDIDCGGPDCSPCPTCSDGIQNGDETGIDCGGSQCTPCLLWAENDSSIYIIDKNIGIGTNSPASKLSVIGDVGIQGNVKALDFTASPTIWPDYVFQDHYILPSLAEIERFIKTNGHLPRVPSSEQVMKHGSKLSETDVILLEKIEEMTLYIIELNKKVKHLEAKLKEKESSSH